MPDIKSINGEVMIDNSDEGGGIDTLQAVIGISASTDKEELMITTANITLIVPSEALTAVLRGDNE